MSQRSWHTATSVLLKSQTNALFYPSDYQLFGWSYVLSYWPFGKKKAGPDFGTCKQLRTDNEQRDIHKGIAILHIRQ